MNAISIDYLAATKVNGAWGKVAMIRCLLLTVALLVPIATSSQPGTAGPKPDVETYFRQSIGLSQDQITSSGTEKLVTKSLPSRSLAEVFLFGAAYVHAAPERYVKFARDYDR